MSEWTKILPMFFVSWYAKRYCERVSLGDITYAIAYHKPPIMLIQVSSDE